MDLVFGPKRMNALRRLLLAPALLIGLGRGALAQDEENPHALRSLPPDEQRAVVARAAALLQEVRPAAPGKERREWKVIERAEGTVHWGNFVRAGEVAALVNVKEQIAQDRAEAGANPPAQYLCYYIRRKGRWEFRQFLGNADHLEIHYRRDQPSVFLQGSFRTGRYDGENVSWFLDGKGRFVPTGFEDWGPFYIKGNYLVCTRGFERLAHDDTRWIYAYRNGRKGALLARYHARDDGPFDITFPDASGQWWGWDFHHREFDGEDTPVTVIKARDCGHESELTIGENEAGREATASGELDSAATFEHLTGLDPALLEEGWEDALPPHVRTEWEPVETKGDPEIAKALGGKSSSKKGKLSPARRAAARLCVRARIAGGRR